MSYRSLLRWRITSTFMISKPVRHLQECCFHHGLNYSCKIGVAKGRQGVMDLKRQKTVTPMWRPVCTQSSSSQECLAKELQVGVEDMHCVDESREPEVGIQVEEALNSISSRGHEDGQVDIGPAKLINSSRGFQENNDGRAPGGGAVPSDEKHSSSVKENDDGRAPGGGAVPSDEKHTSSVKVGASLFRFIKGKGGSIQKNIEEEIGVKIIFPSSKEEDSVVIKGISSESVIRASEKIKLIIDKAVKSPNLGYSHFVSLPLAIHAELVDKLLKFEKSILGTSNENENENLDGDSNGDTSEDEDKEQELDRGSDVTVKPKVKEENKHVKVDIANIQRVSYPPGAAKPPALSDLGIEKSMFIKPKTIHLTVLMLKLWNKDRVDAAANVLQSVTSKVLEALDSRPVFVRLKGLERMKGSLEKARVVYTPVEEIGGEGRLTRASQVIIDAFIEAGLVLENDAQKKLWLHATVINVLYARKKKRGKRTPKLDSFDARGIFNQFGSEEWGDYLIPEAHLSQRFAYDENGYYHCCAAIPFPEVRK